MITWSFFETSIDRCAGTPEQCVMQSGPVMSFTLSNATETGSYHWANPTLVEIYPLGTSTDPGFSFHAGEASNIYGPTFIPHEYAVTKGTFDMSWDEIDGALSSLSINFRGDSTWIYNFGLNGGDIATDGRVGGCGFTTCTITGYWVDPPVSVPVPEPSAIVLLLTATLCFAAVTRRARR